MVKSFMTNMPDQCGAFLAASRIIERHQGNIVRVSYNKAVDAHALFLDVEADDAVLSAIEGELNQAGFLKSVPHAKIILAQFDVPDHPGAVVPILEVLNRHHVNISYISSQSNDSGHASLKMGLYIEEPGVMDTLLRELSALCPVQILSYDSGEKKLDTTVFYLRFASEIRRLLRLTQEQTNEFTYYANLIMQELDERNEPPSKTFEYINRFARFVAEHNGAAYECRVTHVPLTEQVRAVVLEPPFGSNITVLEDVKTRALLVIDSGFRCCARYTLRQLRTIFPDFDERKREMLLTHSDSDHTGLAESMPVIWCSQRTADCFANESLGLPPLNRLRILNTSHGDDEQPISPIGAFLFGDMRFNVLQGNGGHVPGETMLIDPVHRVAFTGDDYINPHNMTPPQKEFDRLAPYLARSVNVDSPRYHAILRARGFASGLHKGLRPLTLSRDSAGYIFMLCPRVDWGRPRGAAPNPRQRRCLWTPQGTSSLDPFARFGW